MNLERIESLLKLMEEYKVVSLEVEEEGLRIKVDTQAAATTTTVVAAAPAAMPMITGAPSIATAPLSSAAPAAPAQTEGDIIKAPMVATFYESPKPDAAPFVKVGSRVSQGDVLCILEAMKLMNELESEVSGVVAEIYVDNAQPVQFGQPLFRITQS